MQPVTRWIVLGTLGTYAATGCSDAFGIDDVLGAWEVATVNGMAVPGEIDINVGNDTETISIYFEGIAFLDGGECSYTSQVSGQEPFETDDCAYTVNLEAETITITLLSDIEGPGTFNSDELTVRWPNEGGPPNVAVYRRQ